MALTAPQLAALKAAILADGTLSVLPQNSDADFTIANAFNLNASPAFTVWKTNVPAGTVGDNLNGTEVAGLTTANISRLQLIFQFSEFGVNPSLIDRRQFFDDVFSGAGGTNTRAKLLILWKRLATRAEKLFATGTGTDPSPATLVFEGVLSYQDVTTARAS